MKHVHGIPQKTNFPPSRQNHLLKIRVINPIRKKVKGTRPSKALTLTRKEHGAMITSNPRQSAARHSTSESQPQLVTKHTTKSGFLRTLIPSKIRTRVLDLRQITIRNHTSKLIAFVNRSSTSTLTIINGENDIKIPHNNPSFSTLTQGH